MPSVWVSAVDKAHGPDQKGEDQKAGRKAFHLRTHTASCQLLTRSAASQKKKELLIKYQEWEVGRTI